MGTRLGIGIRLQRRRLALAGAAVPVELPVDPPVEPPPVDPPVEPPPPPPLMPPGQPGQPTLSARTTDSITVAWVAAAAGGAATSYRVRYSTDNDITAADPSKIVAETNATITGLAPGTDYWIDVIAVNDDGDSVDSADLATATNAAAPPPAPMSNFQRIAALPGAYALHFTAGGTHRTLFEKTPPHGAEIAHTPAGMFSDADVYWIERVRGVANGMGATDDSGNVYRKVQVELHRGGSNVDQNTFLVALSADWSWVLINETTDEWIMWPAANPGRVGGGFVVITVIPTFITDTAGRINSDVDAIAQSFGGGEARIAVNAFQNALPGAEVVLALIPNNIFRPRFPAG